VLSSASKDVFSGSLSQSVQELWLIKESKVDIVAARGLKGFQNHVPSRHGAKKLTAIVFLICIRYTLDKLLCFRKRLVAIAFLSYLIFSIYQGDILLKYTEF